MLKQQTITNVGNNTLTNAFKDLLPQSRQLDALVGYFYFSGFQEVFEELKDKKVRILAGMDIDQKLLKALPDIKLGTSRASILEDDINNFALLFNDTDEFDNTKAVKAFEIFLKKISDGSLEIKKTANEEHTKLYIFHTKKDSPDFSEKPGIVIMGSSNLSASGMSTRRERNQVLVEPHYYEENSQYFEELWNDPENIDIANVELADWYIKEIKKRVWLYQLPSPELLYYRVLEEYYSIDEIEGGVKMPHEITEGKFTDLQYQRDAIERGIDRINRYNGVIIADVVGLGKSIIASTIAHNLEKQTVIIAPPHLKSQWEDYAAEFDFKAHVYSTGKIAEALERHGKTNRELLIILDEAHKHRNEDTENYKLLHQLCAGNKVMALSATPFNNDPKDIYALLKLFTTPGRSTIKTVENLSIAFNELFKRYKKARRSLRKVESSKELASLNEELEAIAGELRRMIAPLVIRRSRIDLKEIDEYREDLEQQKIEFADVEEPESLEYDLDGLSDLYLNTLERISPETETPSEKTFDAVRYKPASYIKPDSKKIEEIFSKSEGDDEEAESAKEKKQQIEQAQVNVAKFMRRLLVRRFESSVEAFRSSLGNMINSAEQVIKWMDERKTVPIFKSGSLPDVETLKEMSEKELRDTIDKLDKKGLIEIPLEEIEDSFRSDLESDIKLLKEIQKEWANVSDPKFDHFIKHISEKLAENKKRKIIIFTEFADTAEYLYAKMQSEHPEIRAFKYTAADSSKQNKQIIRENFDAGLDKKLQKDDYDILIATDAISEGFNLHRAGIIINYDIPYNPTRVIQRVGRINRINKKVFDKLYIYNFFPTFTGELEIKSKAISTFKKKIIDALLGDDTKIFSEQEDLKSFFVEQYKQEKAKADGSSWDSKYYNDWKKLRRNPELLKKVKEIPHRVRIARQSAFNGTLVFARRNNSFVFAFGDKPENAQIISPEIALPMFNGENIDKEKPKEITANFEPVYQVAKEHIFKDNTIAKTKTSKNREEAIKKAKVLKSKYPPASGYAQDLVELIADFDALPIATLKELAEIKISKDPEKAYKKFQEIVPVSYIESIKSTAQKADNDGKLVLLSEQFIKD